MEELSIACKGVSPPRPVRKDIPAVGKEDIMKLLNAMQQSNYYLFYHTLLLTGLRRSELLALKWNALMPYFPRRRKMKMSAKCRQKEMKTSVSRTGLEPVTP